MFFDFLKPDEEDEVVEQPLPTAVQSSPEQGYKIENPMVQDYMQKFSQANRQKLVDQNAEDASGPAWLAGLAALGSGLQGGNAAQAGADFLKMQQGKRDAKLGQFDEGRKMALSERDDAESQGLLAKLKDPNSQESKSAQEAALSMGVNPEIAKTITAERFKTMGPVYEQIYKVKEANRTRQDALNAKKEERLAKQGEGFTEGRKSVDKDYAKDFNDFTGGGETKAVNAIDKLNDLRAEMAADNGLFQAGGGPISGSLPDAFRTQSSIARRDNIVSAANSALKATFGGQLSDGERKALANEFYNDKLSNAENLKIIDRKIKELKTGLVTQKSKAQHFAENGTLTGFKPPQIGSGGLVKLRAPDGSVREVREEDVEKYLKKGAQRV